LLEGTGDLNEIPERLRFYFDIEKYARDLMISDFSESNGYYFSNNW
jgi:antirestriction protein